MSNQIPQLQFVNMELTLKCNFRCLHCGSTAGKPRSNELKFDEWISVMKQLAELGCREVCILGGEPFLMPEWFAIARIICDLGMNLVIITNGWFIEQQIVDQLKTLKRLDRIGVSLDGATPEVHDKIRGRRSSFQKALNALWLLRDAGFEAGAITSVSKLNLSELFKIRDLLVGQNITLISLVCPAPSEKYPSPCVISNWSASCPANVTSPVAVCPPMFFSVNVNSSEQSSISSWSKS